MEGFPLTTGQEWLIDVYGCDAERLRDPAVLSGLFEELIVSLSLKVLGTPQWHRFPEPGGVTGLVMLAESHLAIHTFPEHGFAAINVYCCRERAAVDFQDIVGRHLGAASATVRALARGAVR